MLSVARLTEEPEVPGSIPGPATYFQGNLSRNPFYSPPSTDSRKAIISLWRKHEHLVLVNRLGLSLSVVRLTDHPELTMAAYH